jgi:hypothetical protein
VSARHSTGCSALSHAARERITLIWTLIGVSVATSASGGSGLFLSSPAVSSTYLRPCGLSNVKWPWQYVSPLLMFA